MSVQDICALISGGFVVSGSQCVVAIESEGECTEMVSVESVTPKSSPEELLEQLSQVTCKPPAFLTVTVYGICGGIHGKGKESGIKLPLQRIDEDSP